jgi:hypothetical protein
MIGRLRAAPSVVNDFGEWKYDRVPAKLVSEILNYLQDRYDEVTSNDAN